MYFISRRVVPMKTTTFDIYDITLGDPNDSNDLHVNMGHACFDKTTHTVRGLYIEPEYRDWGYAGRLLDQIFIDYTDAFVNVPIDTCVGLTLFQLIQWLERRGMYVVNRTDSHILLAQAKDNVRFTE